MPPSSFIGFTRELPSIVPPSCRMPERLGTLQADDVAVADQPGPAVANPEERVPAAERAPADRADRCVETWCVTAARQNSDPLSHSSYLGAELVTNPGVTEERLFLRAAEYDCHPTGRGGGRGRRRGRHHARWARVRW